VELAIIIVLAYEEGRYWIRASGFAPLPPTTPIWRGTGRSAKTPIPDLYLASSYAGSGGFTGAILAGGTAADLIL